VKVGDPAPRVEAESLFNCPYGDLGALQGKLVLYFWFLPESRGSSKVARAMNTLLDRYRREGLEIVGISHRDREVIERWVRRRRPRFIVAFEPSNMSMGSYPFTSWPSAALVSPRGRVLKKGSPTSISEGLIKQNLRGARGRGPDAPLRFSPVLPPVLKKISTLVEDGRLARALEGLEEWLKPGVTGGDREAAEAVRGEIRALLTMKLEDVRREIRAGRFFEARLICLRIQRHAPETRWAAEAGDVLKGFQRDPAILREIRGGKDLHRAETLLLAGKRKKALRILKRIAGGQWQGTRVRERARALLAERFPEVKQRRGPTR